MLLNPKQLTRASPRGDEFLKTRECARLKHWFVASFICHCLTKDGGGTAEDSALRVSAFGRCSRSFWLLESEVYWCLPQFGIECVVVLPVGCGKMMNRINPAAQLSPHIAAQAGGGPERSLVVKRQSKNHSY
jgi:hypothetical protein